MHGGPEILLPLAYVGPETLMPLASALAAIGGILLLFWHRVVALVRAGFQAIGRRVSSLFSR